MTYHLTITHADDAETQAVLLEAELQHRNGVLCLASSSIDMATDSTPDRPRLSSQGANAFRCLCLAEALIRHALQLPPEPDDMQRLRREVETLRRQLEMKEAGELIGASERSGPANNNNSVTISPP